MDDEQLFLLALAIVAYFLLPFFFVISAENRPAARREAFVAGVLWVNCVYVGSAVVLAVTMVVKWGIGFLLA